MQRAHRPQLVQEFVENCVVRATHIVHHLMQHRAQRVVEVVEARFVPWVSEPDQNALRAASPSTVIHALLMW